jgi:hypothetical protein
MKRKSVNSRKSSGMFISLPQIYPHQFSKRLLFSLLTCIKKVNPARGRVVWAAA